MLLYVKFINCIRSIVLKIVSIIISQPKEKEKKNDNANIKKLNSSPSHFTSTGLKKFA